MEIFNSFQHFLKYFCRLLLLAKREVTDDIYAALTLYYFPLLPIILVLRESLVEILLGMVVVLHSTYIV